MIKYAGKPRRLNFMQKAYWQFYWPLTLTGLAMLLARQCENGILARYPDAANELAVFAYAWSCFFLFNAALVFVPQMVNRLARSGQSRRICFRFVLITCVLLTLPLAVTAFVPGGRFVISTLFDVGSDDLGVIVLYLKFLTPMVFVNGFRNYCIGLLIQARRTLLVTIFNIVYLAIIICMLIYGFTAGWRPVITLAAGQITAGLAHLIAVGLAQAVTAKREKEDSAQAALLGYGEILRFFWPVALTSTMFSLSRPILYSFLSRTPNAAMSVASLRVAFDLAMIFHSPANQARDLFVTFGFKDREGLGLFMTRVMLGLTAAMVVFAATPALDSVMKNVLGVEQTIRVMARQAFWMLCLIPTVITLRNMSHGAALVKKQTTCMGVGSIARNASIYVISFLLYRFGLLNHMSAAIVLVSGFAFEGSFSYLWLRLFARVKGPIPRADFAGALGLRRQPVV
jgi:hypothetical protein